MKSTILTIKDLNQAQTELTKIGVHPAGVQIMALKALFYTVKFEAVDPKTANIVKQEMLSRGGEVAIAGSVGKFEETRTDMILMGTLAQYVRLVRKLRMQSYGECLQVAEALEELLFGGFDAAAAPVW